MHTRIKQGPPRIDAWNVSSTVGEWLYLHGNALGLFHDN